MKCSPLSTWWVPRPVLCSISSWTKKEAYTPLLHRRQNSPQGWANKGLLPGVILKIHLFGKSHPIYTLIYLLLPSSLLHILKRWDVKLPTPKSSRKTILNDLYSPMLVWLGYGKGAKDSRQIWTRLYYSEFRAERASVLRGNYGRLWRRKKVLLFRGQ